MMETVQILGDDSGVAYFGAMAASVSHEIKNCLAIMNENTGLATDLLAMAGQRPPDPARLENIVGRIQNQIQRTDRIVKGLNTFAHSMDKAVQPVDLLEAAELAAVLGARICANHQVQVLPVPTEQPVNVTVSFFHLLHLIWAVMDGAVRELPRGSALSVTPFKRQGQAGLAFSSPETFGILCENMLSSQFGQNLLARISAGFHREKQALELLFPSPDPAAR